MRFRDIPQFPHSYYRIDSDWKYLNEQLESWHRPEMGSPLILNPDFQRGHVWTPEQQTAYVEYALKGGTMGREIYFNCSSWQGKYNTPTFCVDGLQRLTAAQEFVNDRLRAFGHLYSEFEDRCMTTFSLHMLKVKNKRELLKVYLDFNSGGTPHNPAELERIEKMIEETPASDTL